MSEPTEWRQLERHPLSAEYADLPEAVFRQMVQAIREHGIVDRSVTLHEGKILDGWQFHRACIEAGVRPDYVDVADMAIAPEAYVAIKNDFRRHETPQQAERRIAARRQRAAAARAEGKSLRTIAESEGVSKDTVSEDLRCLPVDTSNPGVDMSTPEPEADQSTEPAPAPKPPAVPKVEPPTVTGRDGKVYPNARAADPDPEDDADAVLDDDETPVPAKLREAFGETNLFRRAAVALARAAVVLEEVEHSVAYALTDRQAAATGTGDRRVYSTACRTAEKRMLGMRPARVCCGDGCEKCGGKGYLSAEEVS